MPALYWFVNHEGLSLIIYVLILYFIVRSYQQSAIDLTLFMTLILALLINYSNIFLQNFFSKIFEDRWKLTTKYEELVNKYESDHYLSIHYVQAGDDAADNGGNSSHELYDNERRISSNKTAKLQAKNYKRFVKNSSLKTLENGAKQITFPIIVESIHDKDVQIIVFDERDEQYELPELIKKQYDHIIGAHNTSKIYNQLNIRLDSWGFTEGKLFLHTSRATYYDALVTNRAMDFKWSNNLTTREVFSYGPYIKQLSESELANILGLYGFVISKDGYIPIVKRHKSVSKGKGMYAPSISASLKVKYALNHRSKLNEMGLKNAFLQEVKNELLITRDDVANFELDSNTIATFRDLVEGGKPELLFFVETEKTKAEMEHDLQTSLEKRRESAFINVLQEPSKIVWIHRDEFDDVMIGLECFVHKNKVYKTLPPYAACMELLRRRLLVENRRSA